MLQLLRLGLYIYNSRRVLGEGLLSVKAAPETSTEPIGMAKPIINAPIGMAKPIINAPIKVEVETHKRSLQDGSEPTVNPAISKDAADFHPQHRYPGPYQPQPIVIPIVIGKTSDNGQYDMMNLMQSAYGGIYGMPEYTQVNSLPRVATTNHVPNAVPITVLNTAPNTVINTIPNNTNQSGPVQSDTSLNQPTANNTQSDQIVVGQSASMSPEYVSQSKMMTNLSKPGEYRIIDNMGNIVGTLSLLKPPNYNYINVAPQPMTNQLYTTSTLVPTGRIYNNQIGASNMNNMNNTNNMNNMNNTGMAQVPTLPAPNRGQQVVRMGAFVPVTETMLKL